MELLFLPKIWFIIICFAIPFLSTTPFSHATGNTVKTAVFRTPAIELEPGSVFNSHFYNLDFPRGHIAIKGLRLKLVDENDKPIPSGEAYLHHWVITRHYKRISPEKTTQIDPTLPLFIQKRNSGLCEEHVGQYFGLGSESQETISDIPDPYGIVVGNPADVPAGYEEGWTMGPHLIDTRGVEDRLGCAECVCELYNLTMPGYNGGWFCCDDKMKCRLKSGFKGLVEKKKYYLQYTVKWVDFDDSVLPVRIYILDVTDSAGVESLHNCQLEYEVQPCCKTDPQLEYEGEPCCKKEPCCKTDGECKHVKTARFRMPRGGAVVYGVGHLHTGGISSTLYRQDGEVICSSIPTYEEGKEVGNEEPYILSMSTCYPAFESVKISEGEIILLETNYSNTKRHTGAMGLFYLLLADHHDQSPSSSWDSSSLFKDFISEKAAKFSGITAWGASLFGVAILGFAVVVVVAKRKMEESKDGYQSL